MKLMKTRTIAIMMLLALVTLPLAGMTVVVDNHDGLVQYRAPGAARWETVSAGMEIIEGGTLVSGANGSALLRAGNATIEVDPLSRLTVAQALFTDTSESTSLNMPYGRVRASVRRSRERGMDFRVLTPISTAAVRGTEFSFDGRVLAVQEGDVSFRNHLGQAHSVREGLLSRTWTETSIQSVEATLADELSF